MPAVWSLYSEVGVGCLQVVGIMRGGEGGVVNLFNCLHCVLSVVREGRNGRVGMLQARYICTPYLVQHMVGMGMHECWSW
jgi:hypothetical protein